MQKSLESYNHSPLAEMLGLVVTDLEHGRARVALTLRPEFANWFGILHGGITMTLADHAFGCATNTLEGRYVAIEFNIYFLGSPPTQGQLFAEAVVEHAGRRLSQAKMEVTDESGRIIARASGLVMATDSQVSSRPNLTADRFDNEIRG